MASNHNEQFNNFHSIITEQNTQVIKLKTFFTVFKTLRPSTIKNNFFYYQFAATGQFPRQFDYKTFMTSFRN